MRYGNAVAANTEDHEQKRRQRDQTRDKRCWDRLHFENVSLKLALAKDVVTDAVRSGI